MTHPSIYRSVALFRDILNRISIPPIKLNGYLIICRYIKQQITAGLRG